MGDILCEIINHAQNTGKITLLKVLNSYQKVIDRHDIVYYSDQGAEIYKTLLRWGREKNMDWGKKCSELYPKEAAKLELSELTDHLDFRRQDSPPTRDVQPSSFQILLPKFNDIYKKSKPINPNKTLAIAFDNSNTRKKSWKNWVNYTKSIKQEKILAAKLENKTKTLAKAMKFYNQTLRKKSLESWTKFTLFSIRKKIAGQVCQNLSKKKHWKGWQKALKKREILKGMKFTAHYIHNQWLMKKVVLALTRHVHNSMISQIKIAQIKDKSNHILITSVIQAWKEYINQRLKKKLTDLKSHKLLGQNLVTRGFKMLQIGVEVTKWYKYKLNTAESFYNKKLLSKHVTLWLYFVNIKFKNRVKLGQANTFYQNTLIFWMFGCLKYCKSFYGQYFETKVRDYQRLYTKRLINAWRTKIINSPKPKYPDFFHYLFYLMVSRYNTSKSFVFPIFTAINSKKHKISNQNLQTHIKRIVIGSWAAFFRNLKSKKQKITLSKAKKIFSAWEKTANKCKHHKKILEKLKKKRKNNLLKKITILWKKKYLKIHYNKKILKKTCASKRIFKIKKSFFCWLQKLRTKIQHKSSKSVAQQYSRKRLISKSLLKWNNKYIIRMKKMSLAHKSQLFLLEKLIKTFWSKWRSLFLENLKLEFTTTKVIDYYSNKLLKKCLKMWRKQKSISRIKTIKKIKASEQLEFVLKVKSIKSWAYRVSYLKSKRILYFQLENDRKKLYKRKVFGFLKDYCEHKRDCKLNDSKTGFNSFQFKKKPRLSKQKSNQILSWHLKDREDYIKRLFFEVLVNQCLKKRKHAEAIKIINSNTAANLLKKYFTIIQEYTDYSKLKRLRHQTLPIKIVEIISQSQKDFYFNAIKDLYEEQIYKENFVRGIFYKNLAKKIVKVWAKVAGTKAKTLNKLESARESLSGFLVKKIINAWAQKTQMKVRTQRKHALIKVQLQKFKLKKIINAWQRQTISRAQLFYKQSAIQTKFKKNILIKAIKTWSKYPKLKLKYLKTQHLIKKQVKRFFLKKILHEWKILLKIKAEKSNKNILIKNKLKKFLLKRIIYAWSGLIKLKFNLLKKANIVKEALKKSMLKRTLKKLKSLVAFKIQSSHRQELIKQQLNNLSLKRLLKAWMGRAAFKAQQSHKQDLIKQHFTSLSLKKIIKAWASQARSKNSSLYKQEIISIRHQSSVTKALFYKWLKAFGYKKSRKKIAYKQKMLNLRQYFRLWSIEYKIIELQKARDHKYVVYGFAGLQIYAEKTFQAEACLKRVSIYSRFQFIRGLVWSWKNYAQAKRKVNGFIELNQQRLSKYVFNVLKNNYYVRLMTKEVYKTSKKRLISKFFNFWRKKFKKSIKRSKVIRKLIHRKINTIKRYAFYKLKPLEIHLSLEETRIKLETKPIRKKKVINKSKNLAISSEHYNLNLTSKVFYAWDNLISKHSVKRKRALMHSVFLGWKIVTRENILLKKYLLESNLSERYLRTSRDTVIGSLGSVSSLGSLKSN